MSGNLGVRGAANLQSLAFNRQPLVVIFEKNHRPLVVDDQRYQTERKTFKCPVRNENTMIFRWVNERVRVEHSGIQGTLDTGAGQYLSNLPADLFGISLQANPHLAVDLLFQVASDAHSQLAQFRMQLFLFVLDLMEEMDQQRFAIV